VRQLFGFLILLACALVGAFVFGVLGGEVWGRFAEWLWGWGPFSGPKAPVDRALRAGPGLLVGIIVGVVVGLLVGFRWVRRL
jgi:hypothetical protein